MSFNVMLQQLAGGMLVSIEIFFITLLFSLPLGLLICFGRMSRNKVIRTIVSGYISIMRGTPLMLQLMVVYFGPYFIFGIRISMGYSLIAVFIAFAINYAAYFAEIYRGGIEGVPHGQREAGEVLGMTKRQIFFKITLLQVIKRIVPPMSNEIITLVKDTSLARTIAIMELVKAGESYMKSDGITWPLFYTAVYYLLFVGVLTILFNWLEKKLDYFK